MVIRRTLRRIARGSGYRQGGVPPITRTVHRLIKIIGAILLAIFTYLQVIDIPLGTLINSVDSDLLRRFTVILYYWCWVFGATFDNDIQEFSYFAERGTVKLRKRDIALIVAFGFVGGALLWASRNDQAFAIVLTLFFAFNIFGFWWILQFVGPLIKHSRAKFEQERNFFSLVQLGLVSDYMKGLWQWLRFGAGILLVSAMDGICFSNSFKIFLAQNIGSTFGLDASALALRLPTFAFVAFVIVMEGWIWMKRAQIRVSLDLLGTVSADYALQPLETRAD